MNIGELLIIFSFILTIASAFTYYLLLKGESGQISGETISSPRLKIARYCFYGAALLVSVASIYLMVLIFTHQFQFAYVYQYSSRELPVGFLISTFWAGQEGSFLLWAFFMAVMGVVFSKTAKEFEFHGMFTFAIIQAFFLVLLIKASPFRLLAQAPANGAGLNPLLQNFWMVIHPPMLFLGYAAIAVPFSIAIAALAKKDYRNFVAQSLPWTLFSSFALGAGIILGGFWAYVTLGWGGYWGWDPVENSSLIPWITILALLHGLIVQNVTGSLKKSNFFLAIFSFVLVIYATFLTRSGVLEDFSVHSFQNLGINLYLIVFILTMIVIGLVVFFKRYREIPNHPVDFSSLNRENIILMSMLIMVVSTALIFVCTSSPILTGLTGQSSQVGVSYYNKVNFPIAIIMALLLGFAPFSRWKEDGFTGLLKGTLPSLILTIATTIIIAVFTPLSLSRIIFLAAALFALFSNSIVFLRYLKTNWRLISAPLSHVGVALMLLGIIISGTSETNEKVLLEQNIPQKVLDYKLEYTGITSVSNGKDILNIKVSG
ncbi:MAG: cytochrome c biogenesis protein CcsA, partial [Calditrichia bacterium]